MGLLKVTCTTQDESDPHRPVRAIGGDGFYHTVDEAIGYINSNTHHYFTEVDGESVWVEVAHHPDGTAYLKTEQDGFPPAHLLSLAECSRSAHVSATDRDESLEAIETIGDGEPRSASGLAEQLALTTAVRLLVLDQFGRKEGRLEVMLDRALRQAGDSVEQMDMDENSRSQLQAALARQLELLFAQPAER